MDIKSWKDAYRAARKRPGMYFGGEEQEQATTYFGSKLLQFITSCQSGSSKNIDLHLSPQGTYEVKAGSVDFSSITNLKPYDNFEFNTVATGSLWAGFRMPNGKLKFFGQSNPPFFIMDVKSWDKNTIFRSQLDPECFNIENISVFPLKNPARSLAISKPGSSIRLSQDGQFTQLNFPNGPSDRLMEMDWGAITSHRPVRLQLGDTQNHLDMAFQITDSDQSQFETYFNGVRVDGGRHIEEFVRQLKKHTSFPGNAIFSFWLSHPEFHAYCKDKFNTCHPCDLVQTAMKDKLLIAMVHRPELVDIFNANKS